MRRYILLIAVFVSLCAGTLRGQGCSQCRDNTAATPPKTQAAYRHAIFLLVVAAGSLFAGTVVMLKRFP